MIYNHVKRRVFISHYKGDRTEVDMFINEFANQQKVFIPYVLGANDNDEFINSTDPNYVMSQIRAKYLQDTTVTIVLVGSCTHSRRYVDWEIKSSLQQGLTRPNGIMGIILKSQGGNAHMPPRLFDNWNESQQNCYARYWVYPSNAQQLSNWIEDAYRSRETSTHLIKNTQEMMKYNRICSIHNFTH